MSEQEIKIDVDQFKKDFFYESRKEFHELFKNNIKLMERYLLDLSKSLENNKAFPIYKDYSLENFLSDKYIRSNSDIDITSKTLSIFLNEINNLTSKFTDLNSKSELELISYYCSMMEMILASEAIFTSMGVNLKYPK